MAQVQSGVTHIVVWHVDRLYRQRLESLAAAVGRGEIPRQAYLTRRQEPAAVIAQCANGLLAHSRLRLLSLGADELRRRWHTSLPFGRGLVDAVLGTIAARALPPGDVEISFLESERSSQIPESGIW